MGRRPSWQALSIDVVPVLKTVWTEASTGASVGLICLELHQGHCVLRGTLRSWPSHDEPDLSEWALLAEGSARPLAGQGGGAGGGSDARSSLVSWRFHCHFESPTPPSRMRIVNAPYGVDTQLDVVAMDAVASRFAYGIATERPRLGEIADAVWRSGAGRDSVPLAILPLQSKPFTTEYGPVVAAMRERWRACDVVRFSLDERFDVQHFRITRTAPGRLAEHGVHLGGHNGPDGLWMDVAFPDT